MTAKRRLKMRRYSSLNLLIPAQILNCLQLLFVRLAPCSTVPQKAAKTGLPGTLVTNVTNKGAFYHNTGRPRRKSEKAEIFCRGIA
jgi:hypothetical protein